MSKPLSSVVLILSLMAMAKIASLFLIKEIDPCTARQLYLEEDINERVSRKYIRTRYKSFSKDTSIVLVNNKPLYIPDSKILREVYALVDSNDLVIKRRNSDTLFVYKNDQVSGIFLPRFTCNTSSVNK